MEIIKLKTKEELIEEFGFKPDGNALKSNYKGKSWFITSTEIELLGKIICIDNYMAVSDYTHVYTSKVDGRRVLFGLHELWFTSTDFLNKDEFSL